MTGAMDALVAEYIGIRRDLDIALSHERQRQMELREADAARTAATNARVGTENRLEETKIAIDAIQRRDNVAADVVAKMIGA